MQEYVVLVNAKNEAIGKALKSQVHTSTTPLHRGFSVFLFNTQGLILLQKRSLTKITWPGMWSNSCCGHPGPKEQTLDAAKRRLQEELGLTSVILHEVTLDYQYRVEYQGVVENEFCPLLVAFSEEMPQINTREIEAIRWVLWREFIAEIERAPKGYTPWCVDEARLLSSESLFQQLYRENTTGRLD